MTAIMNHRSLQLQMANKLECSDTSGHCASEIQKILVINLKIGLLFILHVMQVHRLNTRGPNLRYDTKSSRKTGILADVGALFLLNNNPMHYGLSDRF